MPTSKGESGGINTGEGEKTPRAKQMNRILFYWVCVAFFAVLLASIAVSVYRDATSAIQHLEEKLK
jgi:hypothetical protein